MSVYSNRVIDKLRFHLYRSFGLFPRHVECNICGARLKFFGSDPWHLHVICTNCHSDVRHRLLIGALTYLDEFLIEKLARSKNVLHFAPEPSLGLFFRKLATRYVTADMMAEIADMQLDMSNMHGIKSGEYDLIIACDVLEHVVDDIKAMKECYRVLSDGGYALYTVPQKDDLKITYEDESVDSPEDRERFYGQSDHLRIYGDDFEERLESVGFSVSVIDSNSFKDEISRKHVLFPPILSRSPLATNYRKVFIAHKLYPNS